MFLCQKNSLTFICLFFLLAKQFENNIKTNIYKESHTVCDRVMNLYLDMGNIKTPVKYFNVKDYFHLSPIVNFSILYIQDRI